MEAEYLLKQRTTTRDSHLVIASFAFEFRNLPCCSLRSCYRIIVIPFIFGVYPTTLNPLGF